MKRKEENKKYILKAGVLKVISIIELFIFFIIVSCIEILADHIILLLFIIIIFIYLFYILKKYNYI